MLVLLLIECWVRGGWACCFVLFSNNNVTVTEAFWCDVAVFEWKKIKMGTTACCFVKKKSCVLACRLSTGSVYVIADVIEIGNYLAFWSWKRVHDQWYYAAINNFCSLYFCNSLSRGISLQSGQIDLYPSMRVSIHNYVCNACSVVFVFKNIVPCLKMICVCLCVFKTLVWDSSSSSKLWEEKAVFLWRPVAKNDYSPTLIAYYPTSTLILGNSFEVMDLSYV